ncbi:MAG: tRNA (N6-isopentenyl adenosine(37)-C2)-methylthiotransferase MiaB [Patescibacteria group bacterium]
MSNRPKFHIITFGCQMNQNDSERISSLLNNLGFDSTTDKTKADIILLNTCSVRQSAEDRIYGNVRNLAKLKRKNPNLIIAVTGCMPGRDRDGALRKKLPAVDLFFPTTDAVQLPRWIAELRPELVNNIDVADDFLKLKPDYYSKRQAFVTIQTGCNNFCTYCVVPFARGLEKNRPLKDIMSEVRELAQNGCVEITLLGQTVNSYIAPDSENFSKGNPFKDHFAVLLWEVNQIEGISRLHFTAPHPMHMSDEVIEAMKLPAHMNVLHLPVQSGDNEVLRKMNRRYSAEDYLEVIGRVKKQLPGITLATDIIVGFCGESEEQFQRTVDLYKQVEFDISYTAQYSVRSGTAAWRAFTNDVPRTEKKRRWQSMQKLMEEITLKKNQEYVGKEVSVLVERHEVPALTGEMLKLPKDLQDKALAHSGFCFGNSRELKLVRFEGGPELVGQIVNVKIDKAQTWVLLGSKK